MITIAVGGDVIHGMSIGVIVHGAVDDKISMAFEVCKYMHECSHGTDSWVSRELAETGCRVRDVISEGTCLVVENTNI